MIYIFCSYTPLPTLPFLPSAVVLVTFRFRISFCPCPDAINGNGVGDREKHNMVN